MTPPAMRRVAALALLLAVSAPPGLRHAPSQAQQPPARVLVHDVAGVGVTVSDMDRAVTFYSKVLFFEQERLNNVFGARLRITALRAAAGPAVELLEYLTPRDDRPYPGDARANDLVHWHTIVTTPSAAAAYRTLLAGKHVLISPRAVALRDGPLGFGEAFLARDPDGHALQFRSE